MRIPSETAWGLPSSQTARGSLRRRRASSAHLKELDNIVLSIIVSLLAVLAPDFRGERMGLARLHLQELSRALCTRTAYVTYVPNP